MRKKISDSSRKEIQKKITNRISRIEGQVRGVKKMVEENRDCIEIITQINAVRAAVGKLGVEILKNDLMCHKKNRIDEKYLEKIFKVN